MTLLIAKLKEFFSRKILNSNETSIKQNALGEDMTQTSNQSVNSHVEEYLDYYCGLSHAPGFAVLLKGKWGSGKTWFINRYREKLEDNGKQSLYVSLYGMTNVSEIEYAFFQQLHPFLSSKKMELASKLFQGILKGTLKIDFTNDGKDDWGWNIQSLDINPPEYLKDIGERILIFDDLERCKIEIGNILGYINYFVEQQDIKVILIANEDRLILDDNRYKDIREKLIGRTFELLPDFEGALENFITSTDNLSIRTFLSNNTDIIKALYGAAKSDNLRTLKQIVLDFERIFSVLPEQVKAEPEALKEILRFLMAFSIEIKQGAILPEDISKLREEHSSRMFKRLNSDRAFNPTAQNNNNDSEEETPLQKMLDTYSDLNLDDPFPSAVWWRIFFDKGIVDVQELQQSISNSRFFQTGNTPDWIKLWHYSNFSDDEFDRLLKKIDSEYNSRRYTNLGEIKHIFGLFLLFSNAGIYSKTKEEILEDGKKYIDYLKDVSPTVVMFKVNEDIFGSYQRLGFQGKEFKEFKEFSSYINKVQKLAKENIMPAAAQELLEIMQSDGWRFHRMMCLTTFPGEDISEEKYYEVPILKHIDPANFVKKLLHINHEDRRHIFWTLEERYKIPSINVSLVKELNWLKQVKNLLSCEIMIRKGKISGFVLEMYVKHYFDSAIEKLEKTQKQIENQNRVGDQDVPLENYVEVIDSSEP